MTTTEGGTPAYCPRCSTDGHFQTAHAHDDAEWARAWADYEIEKGT